MCKYSKEVGTQDLKSYISHLKLAQDYIDNGNTLEAKEMIDTVISYLESDLKGD
jgi:hypothetical protein